MKKTRRPVDLLDYQDGWAALVDKAMANGYESLTPTEKIWLNTQYLTNSIRNGGLISYYYNSPADKLDDCMKALQILGASEMRATLECMNTLFPDGVPKDIIARNEVIDSWPDGDEQFDSLLDELEEMALTESGPLEARLVEFIQKTGMGT